MLSELLFKFTSARGYQLDEGQFLSESLGLFIIKTIAEGIFSPPNDDDDFCVGSIKSGQWLLLVWPAAAVAQRPARRERTKHRTREESRCSPLASAAVR